MSRYLLVISASPNPDLETLIADGRAPRKDYLELSRALDAPILYRDEVERHPVTRLLARLLGPPVAQAALAFARRDQYEVVFTDAENVGIPLAMLFKLARVRRRHVMIGHALSARWKRWCFRFLTVQSHVAVIICHGSYQRWLLTHRLGVPAQRVALLPYQVDERFWRPMAAAPRRQVCSIGLEQRDYPTLIEAARGMDCDVVIVGGSFWSRRSLGMQTTSLPANVRLVGGGGGARLSYEALRALYAESLGVVVPLRPVDFPAGITAILEAMAMARAVVVTRTRGQNDVVRDANGLPEGQGLSQPAGFPDWEPQSADDVIGQTGSYVPPDDQEALRGAMQWLADHPAEAALWGANGRRRVERLMTLDQYVARIAALLNQA